MGGYYEEDWNYSVVTRMIILPLALLAVSREYHAEVAHGKIALSFIANLSTFTFVQHGESIHVRYTGTSKVQVKVRETISDTDVVFRYLVRGRVIATLVAQKEIPAFYHHRTEEIGTRIQIVACKTRNLVISTIQHAIASDCSHVTEYGKRYGMFRFPRFPISWKKNLILSFIEI